MLIERKLHDCLFQKKNRTENVKMLLQNNCTNNGVTNGLKKERKKSMQNSFTW